MSEIKIPTTIEEKIAVLEGAREKLANGFTQSHWIEVVGTTHSYCLYGAIEATMGVDFLKEAERIANDKGFDDDELSGAINDILEQQDDYFRKFDDNVNACSLTESMYRAAKPNNLWAEVVKYAENDRLDEKVPGFPFEVSHYVERHGIKGLMASALQSLNDNFGQEAVLDVIDKTIESLKAQLAAS